MIDINCTNELEYGGHLFLAAFLGTCDLVLEGVYYHH